MKKIDFVKEISRIVKESYPNAFWGSCAIWPEIYSEKYSHIIVTVFPFQEIQTLSEYQENRFWEIQQNAFRYQSKYETKMCEMLKKNEIAYHLNGFPNHGKPMQAEFSLKEAARRSGLGWIGKNNLLITPQFGPRIALSGIMVNASLDDGTPIDQNRCGDCRECVDACLFKVLHGIEWTPDIKREEMINYQGCNEGRNRAIHTKLRRKLACGKCIVACPFGDA